MRLGRIGTGSFRIGSCGLFSGDPVEGAEGVDHGRHGDDGEETGGDTADAVTEVQETDGQAAQDDREVEP